MYMSRKAGQMAGRIGLKFCVDTHGWRGGGCYRLKNHNFIFFNFFSTGNAGPFSWCDYKLLVLFKTNQTIKIVAKNIKVLMSM